MTNRHDNSSESGGQRSAFAASFVMFGMALTVDMLVEAFTGWTPSFWLPPLSDSFFSFHGLMVPTSPGLFVGMAAAIGLWLWDGRRIENAE